MLNHKMLGAVQATGFDPYQGFLHQLDYKRPSLALDLMEEFRPLIIDSLVLRICNDGRVTPDDFRASGDAQRPVVLGDRGKRAFLHAFEERVRTDVRHPEGAERGPGRVSYHRSFLLQARRLARTVQGGEEYVAFTAR